MKRLTVVPHGGLCNRLRVLLSALHVSRQLADVQVDVVWARRAECGADFAALFQPIKGEGFGVRRGAFWLTPVNRRNAHVPALLRSCWFDKQIALYHPSRDEGVEALLQRYDRLYLSTPYALCPYPPALAQQLRPTAALQAKIDACLQRFGLDASAPSLGVHIRRTDNVQAQAVSTLEAFREGIRQFLQHYPQGIVFVASDEPVVATALAATFGEAVRFRPAESVQRARSEDIMGAVVDLYVLSACTYVLGSYWSSFSDMAAELGGKELIVAGKSNVKDFIRS